MQNPKHRAILIILLLALTSGIVVAFCGFYVSKIDADLFNESSKVIIARSENRTILSMANDYKGAPSEFAMIIPVPDIITQEQIQVGNSDIFTRLDAYSAPRLVEYYDPDPCYQPEYDRLYSPSQTALPESAALEDNATRNSQGVTVEAEFSKGEYDIVILSATQSDGLESWLIDNGYALPEGASEALAPYIAMGMKFFVAKINLEAFENTGLTYLRPLVMAMETDGFMLPIQLGMVNAAGPQDLVVYLLSPEGQVALENYPLLRMPSNVTLPEYVENDFAETYRAMFQHAYEKNKSAAFLEYAWDMSWCDPCAADPLNPEELAQAGVFWLDDYADFAAPNVFLTRMHIRYSAETFPEDLMFTQTQNRENFQARYVLQRPFDGELNCQEATTYVRQVQERREQEARTLAELTGWNLQTIHAEMGEYNPEVHLKPWWQNVFDAF